MTIQEFTRKICHKVAQLEKAEMRCAEEASTFNLNNYESTRRVLHLLALDLAKATE